MSELTADQFVRSYATDLLRSAMLLTGDRVRAEDLVQETLTRLLPQWDRVAAAESPLAYVRRSLVNRFVSQRRLMGSRVILLPDTPDEVGSLDVADRVTVRQAVADLLASLPARQRAALVLRYYHDLPDPEIAAMLGCRVVTVRSLISRALHELRSAERISTLVEETR